MVGREGIVMLHSKFSKSLMGLLIGFGLMGCGGSGAGGVMRAFLLAFFLVNLSWFFLPSFGTATQEPFCSEAEGWTVPEEWHLGGETVPCADVDRFLSLMKAKDLKGARALLKGEKKVN
jgi:hypothetical protein